MGKRNGPRTTVVCVSCHATNTVRTARVIPCGYYACGPCERLGRVQHAARRDGEILLVTINAAGGFWGYTVRTATQEESDAVARAKGLVAQLRWPEGMGDA